MKSHLRLASFAIMLFSSLASGASPWPVLGEVDVSVGLHWRATRNYLDIPLYDLGGAVRYRLICRGGHEEHLDELAERVDINYVGPLMCILNDGNRESEASLLREEAVAPWFTRGQFRNEDLIGPCADYPDYGRIRSFRLRGFVLTLEVADVEVADGQLVYSTFKVSVRQDPRATSQIAAPSRYTDPRLEGGKCVSSGNPRN